MKFLFRIFLPLALILGANPLFAQEEANNWFFGNISAIDFNGGPPVSLTTSAMVASEGCASISDDNGNLLFYTNGLDVWDNTHQLMQNGTGLLGGTSSTQSSIIVPKPGSSTLYYIFAVPAFNTGGLSYSEVDMTLNGGLGGITPAVKNVPLFSLVAEKVTAVVHANQIDYWVVAHEANTDRFISFEVTSAGVNPVAVFSAVGTFYSGSDFGGYLKASPDGSRLAAALAGVSKYEVLDFDNATGQVTNLVALLTGEQTACYGVEFSPNGQLLYAGTFTSGIIHQWDLSLSSATAIQNSDNIIGTFTNSVVGALQLAPDGKIYASLQGQSVLGVIDEPNVYGAGATLLDTGIVLSGTCFWGLPTFIQSFFNQPSFSVNGACLGNATMFTSGDTTGIDSLLWNFGDPTSGTSDTSTALNPSHVFTDTGTYSVTLTFYFDTIVIPQTFQWLIYNMPTVSIGPDDLRCEGDTVVLQAMGDPSMFTWSEGSTDSILTVTTTGIYWVQVTNPCATVRDSATITFHQPFTIVPSPDTSICDSTPYLVDPQISVFVNYLWQDSSTDSTFMATGSETVILTASNGCDTQMDTTIVQILPLPLLQLPQDISRCSFESVDLSISSQPEVDYLWANGSTDTVFTVDSTGIYWVQGSNACGTSRDSIFVQYRNFPLIDLGVDTSICLSDSLTLDVSWPNATYLWEADQSTAGTFTVAEDGFYRVSVTADGCTVTDSIQVIRELISCVTIDCTIEFPNVLTPNGDGQNDVFIPLNDCEINEFEMKIFNRWGGTIFTGNHQNIGWDGYINGRPASPGVYFYVVDFRHNVVVDQDRRSTTGSFTLFR